MIFAGRWIELNTRNSGELNIDVCRTLKRKMIKFFQNKHFKKFGVSVVIPLLLFWKYWRTFDGQYTGTDMFWGVAVTMTLAFALYLYLPIFKKVERGSIIWFLGLVTSICLFIFGSVLSGLWTHWIIVIPVAEEVWGEYISFFALMMLLMHIVAKNQNNVQDEPHKTSLFRGPAAWNKADR